MGREGERKLRAGHHEVLGKTLAKVEFLQHGGHSYGRFIDIGKIDLILRRQGNGVVADLNL